MVGCMICPLRHALLGAVLVLLLPLPPAETLFWPFNVFTKHQARSHGWMPSPRGHERQYPINPGLATHSARLPRRTLHPRSIQSFTQDGFASTCRKPNRSRRRSDRRAVSSGVQRHNSNSIGQPHQLTDRVDGSSFDFKVLNLNTWGLAWPWSQKKNVRFNAIRNIIGASDYDVVLLQEVWSRTDYEKLCPVMPYITKFESFNGCSGSLLPVGCSGLVIMSRHPIVEVEFMPFSTRGSPLRLDGEIFVSKGVGRARVVVDGTTIDLFTTHLISYTISPSRDNNEIRIRQSTEMLHFIRDYSNADVKIFGGDINALPLAGGPTEEPYEILTSYLTDALLESYEFGSFLPYFASYGNKYNSHSQIYTPQRIDYILYWANPSTVTANVTHFSMPIYMANSETGKMISVSDHEALHTTLHIQRRQRQQYPSALTEIVPASAKAHHGLHGTLQ